MLKYVDVFRPARLKDEKSVRCRVLGATYDNKLLMLVNTTSQTSVEEVSSKGESTTVISFKKYIDIVSAHLSEDHELCHLTERIPSPKGFSFISTIYHIFGNAKSKEIQYDSPIDGFFLPGSANGVYQMIHVIGNRLTHLKITISKRSVEMEKLRGGIHIPNLISYHFDYNLCTLIAIYSNDKSVFMSVFNMLSQNFDSEPPIHVNVMQTSKLPHELALNPLSHLHLPYFHNANNRFYVFSHNNKRCVIQQLFNGPETHLSFCVSTYPQVFNHIINAPNISSDVPLCFARFDSIVIVFVPNNYICAIDAFLTPPSITVLPKCLANSFCSICSSTLPLENNIVDLDTGSIFNIELDFSKLIPFAPALDQSTWYSFALIIFRVQRADYLSQMLNLLVLINDVDTVQTFFSALLNNYSMPSRFGRVAVRSRSGAVSSFTKTVVPLRPPSHPSFRSSIGLSCKEEVEEIEKEFPSCGVVSRKKAFRHAVKSLIEKKGSNQIEISAKKALNFLRKQNEGALLIRDSIDLWINTFHPDDFWKMTIMFVLQNEATFQSFPFIPCLKEELGILGDALCSKPMRQKFESVGIMPPSEDPGPDSSYWKDRFSLSGSSSSDSTITTSSRVFHRFEGSEEILKSFNRDDQFD
ncbi:hypothetical protein TVAG_276870 [Trichomonas vaginalis G3]|uniref:Uncharacterized protein n=1 Tax=Trichomonas vaginalis (strain ATCC PRA-98 / G3) TaxID=412133 RepID=A2FUE7_TRIV3|nr:hypothetical protein TVAGG3_0883870 [Trichomonas vaginalis G3]EAX91468.1 hypothetical protein TVAG_276870 [Trichomonas vaginalis G3]KAI5502244.1 hypothetical protein TVAGG3_0883870 [Trichomonas vaginalis G3]|eukprot:XP_001304398.1 hypothetical protein [Trichomonas vaginalis G3]